MSVERIWRIDYKLVTDNPKTSWRLCEIKKGDIIHPDVNLSLRSDIDSLQFYIF